MAETILITGARAPVALDMARDFKQAGYQVFLADCNSAYMTKWSNVAHKILAYSSPVYQPEQFRRDIEGLIDRLQPKLIIPTCEEVFHLAHPDLEGCLKGKLFAPPLTVLNQLHNKETFNNVCSELNISAPETHIIDNRYDLQTYQGSSKEWVFKPCYSRFGTQILIQPSVDQLKMVQPSEQNPWIAQKFISGQECSFYAVLRNGKLISLAVYQSAWRLKGGASYVFTPADLNAEKQAKIIAEKLAQNLNLTGQLSCDLIIDHDGIAWPIECNPRATSGLHLLTGNGDLSRAIAYHAEYKVAPGASQKYMLPMMLSYGLIKAIKQKKYKDWLSTLKSGSDVISSKNDRLPVLGSLLDTLIFAKHAFKHNLSLSQATTYDIEWNGETGS
ncbi:MAG: ATP-grasp domain-containing protein [Alphaproteobacteria bacterium]